jgi:hypothetical protein
MYGQNGILYPQKPLQNEIISDMAVSDILPLGVKSALIPSLLLSI